MSMKRIILCAASVLALGPTTQALAQQSAMVEEVVVTARRTAESAQTVPLSITAVGEQEMRSNNVQNIFDVQRIVPGLAITNGSGSASTSGVSIRGQSPSDSLLTIDPAVGVYIDEVLIPRGVGLRPSQFDIRSIEVLQGPQGTLFGKNTTGGALLVTSNRPVDQYTGYIDAQLTTYGGRRVTAAANVPLIEDKLIARLALQRIKTDGFGEDELGQPTSDENSRSVRASVIWRPMDDVEVYASYDNTRVRAHPQNVKLAYVAGCTGPNACSGLPLPSEFSGPLPRYDVSGNLIPGTYGAGFSSTIFSEIANELGLALTPANLTSVQNLLSRFLIGGPNDPGFHNSANSQRNSYDNFDAHGSNLQINVEKYGLTFRSITGYRWYKRDAAVPNSPFNPDGPPSTFTVPSGFVLNRFTAIAGYFDTVSSSFTQEFQIQEQDGEGLDFTLGAFYQDENGNEGGPSYQAPALSPAAVPVINDGEVVNQSKSAYLQAIYHVGPTIRVTGGLRYTRDKKSIEVHNGSGFGLPAATGVINAVTNPALAGLAASLLANPGENCTLAPAILPAGAQPYLTVITAAGTRAYYSRDPSVCSAYREKSFSSTNWLVGLDWRPTQDLMVYGRVSTGYKGGGFNVRATNDLALTPFGPETTTEYEVGLKADWLEGRLRTNLATFYTQYRDIQRSQIVSRVVNGAVGTATIVDNAAEATVYGGEVTITAVPMNGLTLTAAGSYVHGRYDEYRTVAAVNPTTGAPTAFNDLSGLAYPLPVSANVPEFRYTLVAAYVQPMESGDLRLNANWSWQSKQPYHATPARDLTRIGAYGLLNLSAAFDIPAWNTELSVFARNVLDKKYVTGTTATDQSFGYNIAFTGDPRVVGVGMRYTFGR